MVCAPESICDHTSREYRRRPLASYESANTSSPPSQRMSAVLSLQPLALRLVHHNSRSSFTWGSHQRTAVAHISPLGLVEWYSYTRSMLPGPARQISVPRPTPPFGYNALGGYSSVMAQDPESAAIARCSSTGTWRSGVSPSRAIASGSAAIGTGASNTEPTIAKTTRGIFMTYPNLTVTVSKNSEAKLQGSGDCAIETRGAGARKTTVHIASQCMSGSRVC